MLQIGQPAPHFTSKAVYDGGLVKEVSLDQFKGRWLVLFFYPLDFTFVCPTEILQFKEHQSQFANLNAEIIGCSVDSYHTHKRWLKDELGDLNFPLVSDLTKAMSRDYNVLIEKEGFATRATFIIDQEGKIQYMGIHNTNVGRDVNEILRVLEALQSGELCGAGWKPGQAFVKG